MDKQPPEQLPLTIPDSILGRLQQAEQAAIDLKYRAGVLEREVSILQAIIRGRSSPTGQG